MDNNKDTDIDYNDQKSPMDNLLANVDSDSEKLEIHEFARKHGISENESLWNQLLLQTGIVKKHQELLKDAEKIHLKHVSDIQSAMDFALKKILDVGVEKTNEAIESINLKSDNKIQEFEQKLEYFTRQVVTECGNQVNEACKGSITTAFDVSKQSLSETLEYILKASKALEEASEEARKDIKASLLEIGIYCGVGSLIGAAAFCLMFKLLA